MARIGARGWGTYAGVAGTLAVLIARGDVRGLAAVLPCTSLLVASFVCQPGHHACGAQCLSDSDVASCGSSCTPCANPSASHCTVDCAGTSGSQKCVVSALDSDGDGHGDDACPVSGGDCDDTNPTAHPGAPEKCNGLDDDCNGLDDWTDLGPKWGPQDFATGASYGTAIAYSPASGKYGVAFGSLVQFALMGTNGLQASTPGRRHGFEWIVTVRERTVRWARCVRWEFIARLLLRGLGLRPWDYRSHGLLERLRGRRRDRLLRDPRPPAR